MTDDVHRGVGWPLWVEADVSGAVVPAMFALPSGTVTFLLTDVEGSTRGWERAPEGMTVAIPRQYELLDEAITCHGGVRPVERGEDDSVVGAFSRASDAVAAAVTAQRAILAEVWPDGVEMRIRMAVHTGEARIRDESRYLGHTLNRCARIRAAAHGGQVLMSSTTASLVADSLPARASLVDLGQHRLKDLGRPEHIWQLVHPDLPSSFPALRSLDLFHQNLPIQLTPLIGRASEIADVCRLVDGDRLVTLTGSAGVGKTRLALAVAAEALDTHPGGVWSVELAGLSDPGAVGRAALTALGAREVPGASVAQQLAVELGEQRSLLVLDNCEHLVGACADLVAALLAANASSSVLATSREPLGVPGEIIWRVPSMRCPGVDAPVPIPALSQFDAVALFVERARRARPSFGVNEVNAPAIAEICHRLDGIPLAIELAAARCRQMAAERIAVDLDDRFRLLTGGARTVMARQQTLAASIDWSHDRLDEVEQRAFRRLGVLAGPFPLEAGEAVASSTGDLDPVEVFDLLSRLTDKSLVVVDEGPNGEPRYRLLESLRAYALDRARAAGELTVLRDAHAEWWADWLEPRGALPADELLAEIDSYHANLRVALDWSVEEPALGLRLLRGVAIAWEDLGRAGDALPAADRLLTDENAEQYTEAWLGAAHLASRLYAEARGGEDMLDLLERVQQVAARKGDEYHLQWARWLTSPPEVRTAVRDMARARGDRYVEAMCTILLAGDAAEDYPKSAGPLVRDAEEAAEASGMRFLRLQARLASGALSLAQGDLAAAIELSTGILLETFSSAWSGAVRDLSFAGLLARSEEALRLCADTVDLVERKAPGPSGVIHNTRHRLQLLLGEPSTVHPTMRATGDEWPPSPWTLWLGARETIDAGEPALAIDGVRTWSLPAPHTQAIVAATDGAAEGDEDRWHDALAIALDQDLRLIAVDAIEGLAGAAARSESWAECLRLLAAAARLRDETGYRWRFEFERQAVDRAGFSHQRPR